MKIHYVMCDDWEGLYVDGKILEQNHSLNIGFILGYLFGDDYTDEYLEDEDVEWLVREGVLPDTVDEFEKKMGR